MKTAHNTAQNEEQNATKPRVLMTTAMHQYRLLQPPPKEWMNEWIEKEKKRQKKSVAVILLFHVHFEEEKTFASNVVKTCATNTWLTIQNVLRAFFGFSFDEA